MLLNFKIFLKVLGVFKHFLLKIKMLINLEKENSCRKYYSYPPPPNMNNNLYIHISQVLPLVKWKISTFCNRKHYHLHIT